MYWSESGENAGAALRRRFALATEPYVLFPVFILLIVALIWGMTIHLVKVERTAAERAALISVRESAATYEAQVVRVLHEIDKTLKVVKYTYELGSEQKKVLLDLKNKALLPPDLIFLISITDRNGNVIASTRSFSATNVAGQEHFQAAMQSDRMAIGHPRQISDSDKSVLTFSRALNAPDGTFTGIVMLSVDAAFFVSGYEPSKLGKTGFLGILRMDGVFLVKRTGDLISTGDTATPDLLPPHPHQPNAEAAIVRSTVNGMRRYISSGRLYEFPLMIVVGVSEDEQLATTLRNARTYQWWAVGSSILLVLFGVILGRMSWQVVLSRRRITEAQLMYAERVEYLAYHDSLTTLPNRSLFTNFLSQAINHAHRYRRKLAILFVDLDGFKHINDTFGHETGDHVLQEVARRLSACMRDADVVARLGGDQFAILLPELQDEQNLVIVARKILQSIAQPITSNDQEFRVTASIGISIYPHDGQDHKTLLKNADAAMYKTKEMGKNDFRLYTETSS